MFRSYLFVFALVLGTVIVLSGAAIVKQDNLSVTYIEVCKCGESGSKVTRTPSTIKYSFRCKRGHNQVVSLRRVQ